MSWFLNFTPNRTILYLPAGFALCTILFVGFEPLILFFIDSGVELFHYVRIELCHGDFRIAYKRSTYTLNPSLKSATETEARRHKVILKINVSETTN